MRSFKESGLVKNVSVSGAPLTATNEGKENFFSGQHHLLSHTSQKHLAPAAGSLILLFNNIGLHFFISCVSLTTMRMLK